MQKILISGVVLLLLVSPYDLYRLEEHNLAVSVDSHSLSTVSPNFIAGPDLGLSKNSSSSTKPASVFDKLKKTFPEEENSTSIPGQAILWGTLKTERHDTVAGEKIKLYSRLLNQQHIAVSNQSGEFVVENISPAQDYHLSLSPRGMYQRYDVDIDMDANQTNINIALRHLRLGLLQGRIVDVVGNPVPGFKFSIRSVSKPAWSNTVTSDDNAQFEIDQVPYGGGEISSNLDLLLKITGLNFTHNSSALQNLVVDTGPYTLSGQIDDESGEATAGTSV